ncbi:hypothetical protein E3V33_03945 [Candidatus Marinimicrobia bacterium MT.SAG.4]|nr:hypothetical protein E3V33_03945 [Candidatus Marinimicrobia bacterium MT.SAG.4]
MRNSGSPAEVFGKTSSDLSKFKGVTTERAEAILSTNSKEFISNQLESDDRGYFNLGETTSYTYIDGKPLEQNKTYVWQVKKHVKPVMVILIT